jgi:hypothetical protein
MRVQRSPRLRVLASIIMQDEFDQFHDHCEWVARAPVGEIVRWAQSIEREQVSHAV